MEQKKILVVDDEENLRLSFQKILQREGFEVKTASSGAEALKIIGQEGYPDLIITDQGMYSIPRMTGMELVAKIHKISQVPCVLMSGNPCIWDALKDNPNAQKQGGLVKFLPKPILKETLLAAVRELIK